MFARLFGGVMVLAHGMLAFATVALLGHARSLAAWEGGGARARVRATEADSLFDLPADPDGHLSDAEASARALAVRSRGTERVSGVVAYLVPLAGFSATAREAWAGRPWALAGSPCS